ncbi:phosphate/phosphite/phosphonate ABC transporter substrate-binding protein [Myxococcota bacterium]
MTRTILPVLLIALFSTPARAGEAPASPLTVVICYPGGPVRAADAKPAMDSMLAVIEEIGQWDKGSITCEFASKVNECRKLMAGKDPHFAILSVGLYLEHMQKHQLVPVAQPNVEGRTTDTYRILVRKGSFDSLAALKGKSLGGTLLGEPRFLKKVVFKSKIDPAKHFKLKPSRRALRALRNLSKGRKLDAVILNEQQYKSLGSLPFADKLEVVFTSEPIPLVGLLANTKKTTKHERGRITQALSSMCTHDKGKELCQMFGIESFGPANAASYQKIMTLWKSK